MINTIVTLKRTDFPDFGQIAIFTQNGTGSTIVMFYNINSSSYKHFWPSSVTTITFLFVASYFGDLYRFDPLQNRLTFYTLYPTTA